MLQSILNQEGVHALNKYQQKSVNGKGGRNSPCHSGNDCDFGLECAGCYCRPIGGTI
ncbi:MULTISPECIES: hypothetical protein [Aquimarina]|uniref:hypothetical protein n=1 Tax=Aquimarina TaxID=290174 RepID=UPI00131F0FF5|nr:MULTISPECIES: hypothetical protein [Aquimarina]